LVYVLRTNTVKMSRQGYADPHRTLDCAPGTEYGEDAFRYFLDIERARAGRSNQPVRLLFASLEPVPGQPVPIPPASANRLFEGLRLTLRDTDIMGWYRQGRVAGAVLNARAEEPRSGLSDLIEQRVGDRLRQSLPSKMARGLRVRVVRLGPRQARMA
jgi:hypothetical protein